MEITVELLEYLSKRLCRFYNEDAPGLELEFLECNLISPNRFSLSFYRPHYSGKGSIINRVELDKKKYPQKPQYAISFKYPSSEPDRNIYRLNLQCHPIKDTKGLYLYLLKVTKEVFVTGAKHFDPAFKDYHYFKRKKVFIGFLKKEGIKSKKDK